MIFYNTWYCFMNLICKDNKDKNIEYSGQIYNWIIVCIILKLIAYLFFTTSLLTEFNRKTRSSKYLNFYLHASSTLDGISFVSLFG